MTIFYTPASGAIDGVNTTFFAGRAYVAGTMLHHLNGYIKVPADTDGIIETDPTLGLVDLKVAPRTGDRVILIVNDGVGTEVTVGVTAVFRSTTRITAKVNCV